MIWLDTDKKMKWLMDALENNELRLVSRKLTKKDSAEIRREITEYKTMRNKTAPTENSSFARPLAAV